MQTAAEPPFSLGAPTITLTNNGGASSDGASIGGAGHRSSGDPSTGGASNGVDPNNVDASSDGANNGVAGRSSPIVQPAPALPRCPPALRPPSQRQMALGGTEGPA